MSNHSVYSVEKLENQLKQRLDALLVSMKGSELSESEMKNLNLITKHRRINSGDIRVSVDDFSTILKEIKTVLGKK